MNKEDLLSKMLEGDMGIDKVLAHLEEEAKRNLAADEQRRKQRNAALRRVFATLGVHASVSLVAFMVVAGIISTDGAGKPDITPFTMWHPYVFMVIVAINIFIVCVNELGGFD